MQLPNPKAVCHLLIILGISGDLAKKKIMPTLWTLYNQKLLPPSTHIVGFARSNLTVPTLRARVDPYVVIKNDRESKRYSLFWSRYVSYVRGRTTTELADFNKLNRHLAKIESRYSGCNRMFYFALPPSIYAEVALGIHNTSMSKGGWTRVVLEKPFGHDLESSNLLASQVGSLFTEKQIYRMDHYLGKEMLQNIMPFRFANQIFEPIWNRNSIEAVELLFKESFGAYGRGSYFDRYGMIRDVVQNHLMQALILVAMEEPMNLSAENVRNQKVKLLKQIKTLELKNVVLGQYTSSPDSTPDSESKFGYLDDPTVPTNSTAATYSMTILHINNTRWQGVPFVIRAGKAMNSNQVEIRIHFKTRPNLYSQNDYSEDPQNLLILRLQPNEAIYQRIRLKRPGLSGDELLESNMDLVYSEKFTKSYIPDAYERLLLDVLASRQANFVRSDELKEAWRIFTPVLHQIDAGVIKPHPYVFGSTSLPEADQLLEKMGLTNLI